MKPDKQQPEQPLDIPPTRVWKRDDVEVPYIRISEVDARVRASFMLFMRGQTCPNIPHELPGDTVYPWDYVNFLAKLRTGREAFWD